MTKVSVLIAIYNARNTLYQCFDSLLMQTFDDWEAICVDDGSTDGSWRMVQEYVKGDSRFKGIRLMKNRGQAYARNQALNQAQGEYVAFLDSDDWLSSDALEKVVDCFDAHPLTDCVLFHLRYVSDKGGVRQEWDYPQKPFGVLTGKEAFRLSLDWRIHGVYVVRAAIQRQYPYDDSSRWFSDDNTTRLHYYASREVRECEGIYYYRQHPHSVSHVVDVHRFDYLSANANMRKTLLEMHSPKEVVDEYENCRWLNVIDMYMFYFKHRLELSEGDRQAGLEKIIRAWKSIDTSSLSWRNRLKPGYWPLRFSWHLFCMQEEVYFSLRKLAGRL